MDSNQAIRPLLGPDDPPAFELVNADGPAPLFLLCDHAGRRVPRALGDLGLAAPDFDRHIAWDIGAADTARRLSALFDAPLVVSTYSRLVIDLNRRVDDPTAMPEISDGTVVPANRALSEPARRARIGALFEPYHLTVAEQLARKRAAGGRPAVVSIHSFTPVFRGFARPWHVGVLWDADGRIAEPLMAALARIEGVVVGDNQPYSERDRHGFTMRHHAGEAGLAHVLIEIRQDLIDTHHGAERWARLLAGALRPILADPAVAC